MPDFACKKISKEDLVKCSFGLNKTEYKIFSFLISKERNYTAKEIGDKITLDRTTVQKGLSTLTSKELVQKRQVNLEKGSYTFKYSIENKEKIKQRIKKIIREWAKSAEQSIDLL